MPTAEAEGGAEQLAGKQWGAAGGGAGGAGCSWKKRGWRGEGESPCKEGYR